MDALHLRDVCEYKETKCEKDGVQAVPLDGKTDAEGSKLYPDRTYLGRPKVSCSKSAYLSEFALVRCPKNKGMRQFKRQYRRQYKYVCCTLELAK